MIFVGVDRVQNLGKLWTLRGTVYSDNKNIQRHFTSEEFIVTMDQAYGERSSLDQMSAEFQNFRKSTRFPKPDDKQVEIMYEAILDSLLTPPEVKKKLIQTQSIDKKWQTVKMHQGVTEQKDPKSLWGDKETLLLDSLFRTKSPDLNLLTQLKAILTSANRELMSSFLDNGGVRLIVHVIEAILCHDPLNDNDYDKLFETMMCCRAIMNNSFGMDGFLSVEYSVEKLTRCLILENKPLALLVRLFYH